MLRPKINAARVKINYRAFSLIEVMLSLTLSVSLLFCLGAFYRDVYNNKIKQDELLFLQKESHQLMNYFQQHIQHLGYQGGNRAGSNFHLFEKDKKHYALEEHCLIFFYDLNSDGCLGKRATKNAACFLQNMNNTKDLAKEIFGFKVENQEIYLYDKNKLDNCVAGQCRQLLDSCADKWKKLTAVTDFKVETLSFTWLKKETLLSIKLALTSVKEKQTRYTLTSYVYLLNHADTEDDSD